MHIFLWVKTYGLACGIADYTDQLASSLRDQHLDVLTGIRSDEMFRHATDQDIIHLQHEYSFFKPGWIQQIRTITEAPIVMTMHSLCPFESENQGYLQVDRVIVHHEIHARQLGAASNIAIIPMGSRPSLSSEESAVVREKQTQGLEEAFPVIGSFGFIRPDKGFEELLAAASILLPTYPKLKLLFVCPPHFETSIDYAPRLIQKATLYGLHDRVVCVTRWQPIDHVVRLLQCADVLVLNYIASPLGGGISAAAKTCLRTGRPLITTDSIGFADLGEAAYRVLSPSPRHVSEGIRVVLSDADVRQRLVKAGQQCIAEHAWDRMAGLHLELYERMVERQEVLI